MRGGLAWVLSTVLVVLGLGCSKKTEDVVVEPDPAPATPVVEGPADYVGTEACASCHEAEHQEVGRIAP